MLLAGSIGILGNWLSVGTIIGILGLISLLATAVGLRLKDVSG